MGPEHDLALLCGAAHIAGKIALRYWRQNPQVWDKGDEGPVTEADLAVNTALHDHLRAERPDYAWLSEETTDDPARLSAEHVFIIDPIDGTRAFIAGEDGFSHALAVARNGVVTAGVVYLPAQNRLFAAHIGGPATLNDVPIRASHVDDMTQANILTPATSMRPEHWPRGVPDLKRSFRASVAYRLALVALGRFDGMLSFRSGWEWDIAAGSLIAERAGAVVSNRHGQGLTFNNPTPRADGLLAAGPALHGALLTRLTDPAE